MPTKPMNQKLRIILNTYLTPESGCWEWLLAKDKLGYGRLRMSLGSRDKFKTVSAHRYAYELFVKPIPNGLNVLHKCDNRSCCNPEHLFLGTQQDNMRDMYSKGRGPKGYKRDPAICSANAKNRTLKTDAERKQS